MKNINPNKDSERNVEGGNQRKRQMRKSFLQVFMITLKTEIINTWKSEEDPISATFVPALVGLLVTIIPSIPFASIILGIAGGIIGNRFSSIQRKSKTKEKVTREKKKVKVKYPSLSVVGVFLNRFDQSFVSARNVVCLTFCVYILLTSFTPVEMRMGIVYFFIAYLFILTAQSFAITYRIKKGYYLSNESETRELIEFIRSNSDDIDFTGTNLKIVSKRDLEDVVLGEMGRIPAT